MLILCVGFKSGTHSWDMTIHFHHCVLYLSLFQSLIQTIECLEVLYLWFSICIRTDHSINQHWFLDLACLIKCTLQCCTKFIWCFYKVTFASKCLNDLLVSCIWLESSGWSPEKSWNKIFQRILHQPSVDPVWVQCYSLKHISMEQCQWNKF